MSIGDVVHRVLAARQDVFAVVGYHDGIASQLDRLADGVRAGSVPLGVAISRAEELREVYAN